MATKGKRASMIGRRSQPRLMKRKEDETTLRPLMAGPWQAGQRKSRQGWP
jgi:hypothetical protein